MLSISSNVRFNLLPYSAAQHPVQCRLHAEVGSIKISHGMLQLCTSLILRIVFVPKNAAWKPRFNAVILATCGSVSSKRRFTYLIHLWSGFLIIALAPSYASLLKLFPINFSVRSTICRSAFSRSLFRFFNVASTATPNAFLSIVSTKLAIS